MYDNGNSNQIEEQEIDVRACRQLWAAVLLQEWRLVFGGPRVNPTLATRADSGWFGSRGFFDVCALAGLDGAAVLQRYRDKLKQGAA